jgi:hypothetical protein
MLSDILQGKLLKYSDTVQYFNTANFTPEYQAWLSLDRKNEQALFCPDLKSNSPRQ